MAIDKYENKAPFSLNQTFILKPTLNNERIIGQYGCFTIHNYSADVGSIQNSLVKFLQQD